MDGTLKKWTNFISGWKERYCIIQGDMFYYYLEKGDITPKYKIHLSVATIKEYNKQEKRFDINTGNGVVWQFKTNTKKNKKDWVGSFKTAKIVSERNMKLKQIGQSMSISLNEENTNIVRKIINDIENSLVEVKSNVNKLLENQEFDVEILKKLIILSNISESQVKELCKIFNMTNEKKLSDENQVLFKSKEKHLPKEDMSFYDVEEENLLSKSILNKDKDNNSNKKRNSSLNMSTYQSNNIKNLELYKSYSQKRTRLEHKRVEVNINLWTILKDAVGKDLNKFSVPVFFNEPISMLQRLCEGFQYSTLLNKASYENDPYLQLAYIAAFNIGCHSLNPDRTLKSFNPLLFETYEYADPDLKFRYFAEQVSHHPAISACYVEGQNYLYYTNSSIKQKFHLTRGTIEIDNIGKTFFNVLSTNTSFSYTKPRIVGRNIIFGTPKVDFSDKFNITNHNTGDYCEVTLYEEGYPNSNDHGYFIGSIRNYLDEEKIRIEGSWLSHFDVIYDNTRMRIWEKLNTDTRENYYFTDFSSNLNYMSDELKAELPPTDSRFRPDQKALERGDLELASSEKSRLEEKQRKKRKEKEGNNKNYKHQPMFFNEVYDDFTGELVYIYNGRYWEDRMNKKYENYPDLF